MHPDEVIARVVEPEIWHDTIWVNEEASTFFVPIWRCGNTTFMHDIAGKLGFELKKDVDLSNMVGTTFIRHPLKRLPGQLWMAQHNTKISISTLLNCLLDNPAVDEHLLTQSSFLTSFNITHFIDIDCLSNTGHNMTDQIIKLMGNSHRFATSNSDKNEINELIQTSKYATIVGKYISADLEMYNKVTQHDNI
jgi:hypothetical protein